MATIILSNVTWCRFSNTSHRSTLIFDFFFFIISGWYSWLKYQYRTRSESILSVQTYVSGSRLFIGTSGNSDCTFLKMQNVTMAVLHCFFVPEVVDVLIRSSGTTTDTWVQPTIWTFIQLLTCWWLAAEMPQQGSVMLRLSGLWNQIHPLISIPRGMFNLLIHHMLEEMFPNLHSFSYALCFNVPITLKLESCNWIVEKSHLAASLNAGVGHQNQS